MSQISEKRKIQPTMKETVINGWGCLLAGIMLSLGFIIGIAATTAFSPQLFGLRRTETALNQREAIIASTESVLERRAQNAQFTQSALNNDTLILNQTATQSQNNIEATQSALAVENERRQTQIALDWEVTQAQAEHIGTQARIEIQYTQAAMGISEPSLATESLPTVFNYDFSQGLLEDWRSSSGDHWTLAENSISAQRDGAWLLSNRLYSGNYRFDVSFDPALQIQSDYFLLVSLTNSEGIAVNIHTENLETTTVTFYSFDAILLNESQLDITQMEILETINYSQLLQTQTTVSLDINGDSMSLRINDNSVLSAIIPQLSQAGVIGIQMPQNTLLRTIVIETE